MSETPKAYGTRADGTTVAYDVAMTFANNGKDYVVCTDNSTDEVGRANLAVATYDPYKREVIGRPETEAEWEMVYGMIDDLFAGELWHDGHPNLCGWGIDSIQISALAMPKISFGDLQADLPAHHL